MFRISVFFIFSFLLQFLKGHSTPGLVNTFFLHVIPTVPLSTMQHQRIMYLNFGKVYFLLKCFSHWSWKSDNLSFIRPQHLIREHLRFNIAYFKSCLLCEQIIALFWPFHLVCATTLHSGPVNHYSSPSPGDSSSFRLRFDSPPVDPWWPEYEQLI